jgi:hypothetical protein
MIVRITRVKVGNRQAPQQQQKPHPAKGGVSAFTRPETNQTNRCNTSRKRLGRTVRDVPRV